MRDKYLQNTSRLGSSDCTYLFLLFGSKSVGMLSQLFISGVLFFLTAYLLRYYFIATKSAVNDNSQEKFPASPRAGAVDVGFWETLGIAWKFRSLLWDGTPSYEKGRDLLKMYSSSLVRVFFLTNWSSARRLAVCSDLSMLKEVFRSTNWLNRVHDVHHIYMGSFDKPLGILFGNGPYWKTARQIVMKGFRDHGITDVPHIEGLFHEEIDVVLNDLQDHLKKSTTDNAIFSPNRKFDEATLNAVFKMLFSRKLNKNDPLESGLADLMNKNNNNMAIGLCAGDFFPFLRICPKVVPSGQQNIKFCKGIYELVAKERKRRTQVNSIYHDLMDSFLKEVEAHEGSNPNYFTFESLQVTIRDLIMAGADTIHVTMEHLLLFMATNPKEQKKVQDEIDRVIGPDRFPTYDDRKSMVYTQAMIQETWRLASITPVSLRMNNEDCQLGGMDIKKGTYLIPMYLGVNHSDELFDDPMLFNPNRFISETGQIANTDKILTFCYGPRACPGELMGRVAVFLFTVVLLREFDWELSDLHPPPSSQCFGGLTRTCSEYFVKIRRRQTQV